MAKAHVWVGVIGSLLFAAGAVAPMAPAAAEPPPIGGCYNLTDKDWNRSTLPNKPAVDCAGSHTAEVMGFVDVPESVARTGARHFWGWAFRQCHSTGLTYLFGGRPQPPMPIDSYALPITASLATFEPTDAQLKAGERWVACVGMNTSPKFDVAKRSGSVQGTGVAARRCVDKRNWRYVACKGRHAFPLTNAAWVAKNYNEPLPGDAAMDRRATSKCKKLAKSAGKKMRLWFAPGKAAWKYGERFAYCSLK